MPVNKTGGKKNKRCKNKQPNDEQTQFKDVDQEYGKVIKELGNGRFMCMYYDPSRKCMREIMGHVCGAMRRCKHKQKVMVDSYVLLSLRDCQHDTKCDIVHVYQPQHVRVLKTAGEITEEYSDKEDVEPDGVQWTANSSTNNNAPTSLATLLKSTTIASTNSASQNANDWEETFANI